MQGKWRLPGRGCLWFAIALLAFTACAAQSWACEKPPEFQPRPPDWIGGVTLNAQVEKDIWNKMDVVEQKLDYLLDKMKQEKLKKAKVR